MSMRAVYGIVAREFVRFLRQRGRVLASIGRQFVWLVFAGGGFAAVFARRNEIDYRVYMAPGEHRRAATPREHQPHAPHRKSTRLNSSHSPITDAGLSL